MSDNKSTRELSDYTAGLCEAEVKQTIKPIKSRKSRAGRSLRNPKLEKLSKKLLTSLDRVADHLLDITYKGLPTRDEGHLLISTAKLIKELSDEQDDGVSDEIGVAD